MRRPQRELAGAEVSGGEDPKNVPESAGGQPSISPKYRGYRCPTVSYYAGRRTSAQSIGLRSRPGPLTDKEPSTQELVFTNHPAFRAAPERLEEMDREIAAKFVDLLDRHSDRVQVRGCYSTVGLRADADLVFWWIAHSVEHLQALHAEFAAFLT